MADVKVTGGMSKLWISQIRKSKEVSMVTKEVASDAKKQAERVMKGLYPDTFDYFYGSVKLSGKWGDTWVLFPVTPMSRKHTEYLNSAVESTEAKKSTKPQG